MWEEEKGREGSGEEGGGGEKREREVDIDGLLWKGREEEKGKVYGEIEKLKGEVKIKSEKVNGEILKWNGVEDSVGERDKEIRGVKELIEKGKEEGECLGKEELEGVRKEGDELKGEVEKGRGEFEG